jgi:hypothetical protein
MGFRASRYSNANRDPRIISAMFDSVCAETGKKISKGTECIFYPTSKKVYCMDSKQATEFRTWKADLDLGCDY